MYADAMPVARSKTEKGREVAIKFRRRSTLLTNMIIKTEPRKDRVEPVTRDLGMFQHSTRCETEHDA